MDGGPSTNAEEIWHRRYGLGAQCKECNCVPECPARDAARFVATSQWGYRDVDLESGGEDVLSREHGQEPDI